MTTTQVHHVDGYRRDLSDPRSLQVNQGITETALADFSRLRAKWTNVLHYGATGNGVADDTTAISRALTDALANAQPLYFPAGIYKVSGSGSAIFTVTKAIHVLGDGHDSRIMPATGTPTTRDVFLYDPEGSGVGHSFPQFYDLWIGGESAGVARYGIHFKPGAAGDFTRRFGVERIFFTDLSSFAVYADGTTASVFTSWMRDCQVDGNGFGATNLYDSVLIDNCVLSGAGYAVDVGFTAGGPGKFTMQNCNVTATSGVRFGGPITSLELFNNYFELLVAFTGADDAYVNLNGAAAPATIINPVVRDNIFTIIGATPPDGLRLNHVLTPFVEGNAFNVPLGANAIEVTANAIRPHIGIGNKFFGAGGRVNNAGKLTSGGSCVLSASIVESTAIANTTNETAYDRSFTITAGALDEHGAGGHLIRVRAAGRFSCTGTPTLTNRIKINLATLGPPVTGGNLVAEESFTCASGVTDYGWRLETYLVVRNAGVLVPSHQSSNTAAVGAAISVPSISANDVTIHVTSQWGAASASNTSTLMQLVVEILGPAASL